MENIENRPLVLTIDFGTQSVRVCVFDKGGNVLAMEKKSYKPAYVSPKPGYAERDPRLYFDDLGQASSALLEKNPELRSGIKAVVMSCFRDTAVYLDEQMKPIRPTILWLDQRYAKCEEKLPLLSRAAFSLVGMGEVIRMNRRRTAMNWIKENEPENFAKISKYIAISTYFIYLLTGNLNDTASNYTGHYPIDFKKMEFYAKPETHMQGQIFSIRKDQLPNLIEALGLLGNISKEASKKTGIPEGIPMFAAGSDKACETLGCGVIDTDYAAISLGTASSLETTMDFYKGPGGFLPSYPFVLPGYHNMDFQIYRGFWTVNWFLREFGAQNIDDLTNEEAGDPTQYNQRLKEVPPGCDGLLLQPYWGSQLDRPTVKGTMVGFSDAITKEHIYRAIIEGIGFELREAKERFEKRLGKPFKEIRIAGGGAKSDEVCQVLCDILGSPIRKLHTVEISSLGASMAGFIALGEYGNARQACEAMVKSGKEFYPDEKAHEAYNDIFKNGYKKLYPSLKKIYQYLFYKGQK